MSYKTFNSIFHEMDIVYEFKGEAEAYYSARNHRIAHEPQNKEFVDKIRDKGTSDHYNKPSEARTLNKDGKNQNTAMNRKMNATVLKTYGDLGSKNAVKKSIDRHNKKSVKEYGLI